MRTILLCIASVCLIQYNILAQEEINYDTVNSTLKGPYLGQKPPSGAAELFAPGIISTSENEALYGVFNNGSYIVFARTPKGFTDWENYPVYSCQLENESWTYPVLTKYLGKPWCFNYPNPVENKEIFYGWWLPLDENGKITNLDIWKVKYSKGKWNEPEKLSYPINTNYIDMWPSLTKDGVLYFFSNRENGFGKADIYRSIPENGKYKSIQNLGAKINTTGIDNDPCISAHGSFLIFSSTRNGNLGKEDLFVAFQLENDEWTDAINLGEKINSDASETMPFLTPDEKFLFFTSTRNGNLDIFWVNVEVILELKSKTLLKN
jgi:Tol biopolymer transport system component